MRLWRGHTATLFAILCLSFASQTHAQNGSAPSDAARKEASEHFQRGVELFQEGAFRAALVEFERANGIAPDYRLLYNIGQVKLQLQDYLGATQSYERYLAEGGADIPLARREDVEKAFETLRKRIGRIAITTDPEGADVFIDDVRVGLTPMPATVAVNVGRHRVFARKSDGSNAAQVIDIAGGDVIEVDLKLEAPEAKPQVVVMGNEDDGLSRNKRIAIAGWAVGGAALLGSGVTALLASGAADSRNNELKKELPDAGKVKDLGDSADTMALTTDALFVLGIIGVAGGTVLWLLDDTADETASANVEISWGVGLGTVTARGQF